jgi:hypothetical protein
MNEVFITSISCRQTERLILDDAVEYIYPALFIDKYKEGGVITVILLSGLIQDPNTFHLPVHCNLKPFSMLSRRDADAML